jgi:hypothetical protein
MAWVALAGCLGLLSSGLFASLLGLERSRFVAVHAVLVAGFATVYSRRAGVDWREQLRRRWQSGIIGGILVGAMLVRSVLAQPASLAPRGPELAVALAWLGGIYGVADAVLLTVIPVLSLYGSRGAELRRGIRLRLRWGAAALAGSLFVTALYHLGFAEYRGASLVHPLLGNAIITVAYLLTGNPIAPILAHVAMHAAAVVHGPATALQLPPH